MIQRSDNMDPTNRSQPTKYVLFLVKLKTRPIYVVDNDVDVDVAIREAFFDEFQLVHWVGKCGGMLQYADCYRVKYFLYC